MITNERENRMDGTPERRLWSAVLLLAFKDLASPYTKHKDRASARALLWSDDLKLICDMAGFDYKSVKEKLSKIKRGQYSKRSINLDLEGFDEL